MTSPHPFTAVSSPYVSGVEFVSLRPGLTFLETVEATVISSNVGEVDSSGTQYTVNVRYRYTYDGDAYTSWSMCPGAGSACVPTSDSRSDMEEVLEDYPEGETVTAYVSPSDPSEAYLIDTEPSPIYLAVSAFGLVFVLIGVKELWTG